MTVVANNININNTKAIVFDWDGTLYNNTVAIKAAMKDVLEEYNINYPLNEAVKQAFDIIEGIDSSNMSKVILNAYRISDNIPFLKDLQYIDKLKLILKLYINYKHYISKSQLYAGADKVVELLSKKFDLVLLTNENKQEILETLKKLNLDNYFKSIITLDEVKNPKSPETIQHIVYKLKYTPEEVVYIGDLYADIIAAKKANVKSIAVNNGLISPELLCAEGAEAVCNHVTDLTKIFDLPEIKVDIERDRKIDLKLQEKKIKRIVHVDFNWFSLIDSALPKKLESHQVAKIIKDPLGFLGALLHDVIHLYTSGEIELRNELEIFEENEKDLLKCLGLIIIHFVNERTNNVFKMIAKNKILKTSFQYNFALMTFVYMNAYPIESKIRIKQTILNTFDRILPENIKLTLQKLTPDEFIATIFEGCELALEDLGIKTTSIPRITNILKIPLIPVNLILGRVNDIIEFYYDSIKYMLEDILIHDFRDKPKMLEE